MTAVEWLKEKFNENNAKFINWSEDYFNEAKEMEKQQIIDAYQQGFNNAYFGNPLSKEQYYKETHNLSQQDKP
jgi:hypothetical protein